MQLSGCPSPVTGVTGAGLCLIEILRTENRLKCVRGRKRDLKQAALQRNFEDRCTSWVRRDALTFFVIAMSRTNATTLDEDIDDLYSTRSQPKRWAGLWVWRVGNLRGLLVRELRTLQIRRYRKVADTTWASSLQTSTVEKKYHSTINICSKTKKYLWLKLQVSGVRV